MLKLVCDKNFIHQLHDNSVGIPEDHTLIITFPLLEEIFSTQTWLKSPDYVKSLLSYILKSKYLFREMSFSDLLLNKVGYTTLREDKNFEIREPLINSLLQDEDHEVWPTFIENIRKTAELEESYVDAIQEFINPLKVYRKNNKSTIGNKRYFELSEHSYRSELDKRARWMLFEQCKYNLKHKQQERLPLDSFNLRPQSSPVDYLSAYFKLRCEGDPALNDSERMASWITYKDVI